VAADRPFAESGHRGDDEEQLEDSLASAGRHSGKATLRVSTPARVVELADTTDSKSVAFTSVRVQVPPRALRTVVNLG
jgi:hypothetical protein